MAEMATSGDGPKAAGEGEEKWTGTVELLSQEGEKFKVEKSVAVQSELVKTMIDDNDDDDDDEDDDDAGESQEIPLPNVKATVLTKVIEFCKYHATNGPMRKFFVNAHRHERESSRSG